MSEKLTHDSLRVLLRTLPIRLYDLYRQWRREAMRKYRATREQDGSYTSPEFIAECLQKLLALHAEVDKRHAMLSGDAYNDSQPTKESDDAQ